MEGQPDVLSAVQKIALAYFGEIGEQSDDRRYCPLSKDSEAEYLGRIQCFRFGSCDFCRMAAVAWQEVGLGAEYADAVAVLRAGQTFAFQVKETPQVRMAIHRLARVLTDERQVDGERAHSIINDLLEFGALTAAGKEPNCSNS
ncbi:hypothetical protein ASG43_08905 [Aureimonas sp. Leaf454]|nr:hypothetical protein ASG43_08905 [Aureimonas sp. Leaf454]